MWPKYKQQVGPYHEEKLNQNRGIGLSEEECFQFFRNRGRVSHMRQCLVADCSIVERTGDSVRKVRSPTVAHCGWRTSSWRVSDDRRRRHVGQTSYRSAARSCGAMPFRSRLLSIMPIAYWYCTQCFIKQPLSSLSQQMGSLNTKLNEVTQKNVSVCSTLLD